MNDQMLNNPLLLITAIALVVALAYRSKYLTYKGKFFDTKTKQVLYFNRYQSKCEVVDSLNREICMLNYSFQVINQENKELRDDIEILIKKDTLQGDHAMVVFKYTIHKQNENSILFGDVDNTVSK